MFLCRSALEGDRRGRGEGGRRAGVSVQGGLPTPTVEIEVPLDEILTLCRRAQEQGGEENWAPRRDECADSVGADGTSDTRYHDGGRVRGERVCFRHDLATI